MFKELKNIIVKREKIKIKVLKYLEDFIEIEYEINSNDKKIKLFDNCFVEKNKNFCFIIIKKIKYKLMEYFTISNFKKKS